MTITNIKDFKKRENPLKAVVNNKSQDFSIYQFKDSKTTHILKASEATKNVLITGETGQGKTTNVLLPMIQSLLVNDCPGLILDIKADLYADIQVIAEQNNLTDRIVYVGVENFCTDINLLASIKNLSQLKGCLSSIKPYSNERNEYWWTSGLQDVLDAVSLQEYLYKEVYKEDFTYNIKDLNSIITDTDFTNSIIGEIEAQDKIPAEIKQTIIRMRQNPFSVLTDSRSEYENIQQKMWRSGQLGTVISPFTREPFASSLFNDNNQKTIHDLIYKDGKIVILVLSPEYETEGYALGKLLREIYFKAVLSNNQLALDNYKIGKEHNRYTFLLIDEYQFYINTSNENGSLTDESWTGISRSYGNINIFATQSISSMVSKAKTPADVSTIIQNCVNEIHLPTKDETTFNHANFIADGFTDCEFLRYPKPNERAGLARIAENGGIKVVKFNNTEIPAYAATHTTTYRTEKLEAQKRLAGIIKVKPDLDFNNFHILRKNPLTITLSNGFRLSYDDFLNIPIIKNCISSTDRLYIKDFIQTPKNILFNDKTPEYLTGLVADFSKYKGDKTNIKSLTADPLEYPKNEDQLIKILSTLQQHYKFTPEHKPNIILISGGNKKSANELLSQGYHENIILNSHQIIDIDDIIWIMDNKGNYDKKDKFIIKLLESAHIVALMKDDILNHKGQEHKKSRLAKFLYSLKKKDKFLAVISKGKKGEEGNLHMIDLYSDMFATVKSFDKILSHISFNYDCAIGLEKAVKQNKVDMGNDSIMENK